MKTVALADLARVAHAKGASVHMNGRTMNAVSSRAAAPPPTAQPPAVKEDGALAGMAEAQRTMLDSQRTLVEAVAQLAAGMREQPTEDVAPIKDYVFDIERDPNDEFKRIARIHAEGYVFDIERDPNDKFKRMTRIHVTAIRQPTEEGFQ